MSSRFTLHRLQGGAPMVLEVVVGEGVEIVEGLLEEREDEGRVLQGSRFTLYRVQEGAPMVLEVVGSEGVEIVEGVLEGREDEGVVLRGSRLTLHRMQEGAPMVLKIVGRGCRDCGGVVGRERRWGCSTAGHQVCYT